MTSRKSRRKGRRIQLEAFFPEARFPDEKFWSKDGSAIHPSPKGPPKGTTGTTMKDLGVGDEDDQTVSKPHRDDLFDHFSKSFPEFAQNIDNAAKKMFGNDYQKTIDDFFKKHGYVRDVLKKLWDGNWTDSESLGEIGFIFDVVQSGITGSGYYNPSHYGHLANPQYFLPKEDYDPNSGDMVPRPGRPKGSRSVTSTRGGPRGGRTYQELTY